MDPAHENRAQLKELLASLDIQVSEPLEELGMTSTTGWDSISHAEVMLKVEEVFGLELSDDEFAALTNVQRILNHLERAK